MTTSHTQDSDCAGHIGADDCCAVCGVDHGDPCADCAGRGFHLPTCPQIATDAMSTAMRLDQKFGWMASRRACEFAQHYQRGHTMRHFWFTVAQIVADHRRDNMCDEEESK